MKNGCNENKAEIAERNERAKKLYRYVSDVARRIDEATTSCRNVTDLFYTSTEVQRQKLRDNCEKLMFLDALNYGKKALELLWRKVYYETVSTAKKLHSTDDEYDSYLFTHILCGIGQFHHIITKVKSEFKLQFKELDYSYIHKDEESESVDGESVEVELQQWGRVTVHSCLIYLGDLSRYQAEIFHTFDPSIAARYYLQAAHIDLSSGMPYNQLGNLYMEKNYNLDSACYYIHCLNTITPFEGAIGNLSKLFEKNAQFYETLDVNNSENLTQLEHIQGTISKFLSLIEIWYFGKEELDIAQRCNVIAQDLRIALDFTKSPLPDINKNYQEYSQAVEEENMNPSYMNGNIMLEIVQICLLTIAKISETDEKKAFAAKAFTLAVLSQLLHKLLQQLKVCGFKNPASKYHKSKPKVEIEVVEQQTEEIQNDEIVIANGSSNGVLDDVDDKIEIKENESVEEIIIQNGNNKTDKKIIAKRRRRRRIASSESSDVSDAETESSGVVSAESSSEDENSDLSCASDSKSEVSDNDDSELEPETNNLGNGDIIKDDNGINNDEDKEISKKGSEHTDNNEIDKKQIEGDKKDVAQSNDKNPGLNVNEIQNFLRGNNFLASMKLLQDWILKEKDLILSCGESGESLFQCLVDLLNILEFYFKPKNKSKPLKESCHIINYARSLAKNLDLEYKNIPLPEDTNLRGTNVCKFDKNAAEWQILYRYKTSTYEENVIRILNFIDFGHQIAKIVPRIRFNRSMQIFYFKKTPNAKLNLKINHKRSREWHNSKKSNGESGESGLLRRLGRLWLASRVRELERWGRACAAPTLLVLDAAALHEHLRRVKQLVRSRTFLILVPTVVLQELDDLKKEQSTARDAIRWLEAQLQSGSRFLRAQRPGQARAVPLLKYPRKAPPHVHNFIQILEFCYHFVAEEGAGGAGGAGGEADGAKAAPMLVLLTGGAPAEEHREFSAAGSALAAGVAVRPIAEFHADWRQSVHKSGKKR